MAVSESRPSPGGNPISTFPWPAVHELIWCKLRHPIVWADVVIDLWPGIIKTIPDDSGDYTVTLLGNTQDSFVPLHAMVPYQTFRMDNAVISKLQLTRRKRTTLLNLEEYEGVEMDDDRFSTVSSAFSFAITFSTCLATVWSLATNKGVEGSGSTNSGSRPVRYALRSREHKEERFDVLWWGPERIGERQFVQLKMTSSAIFPGPSPPTVPALVEYPIGSGGPAFLKIHSIFHHRKSWQGRERFTGPAVAGAIFDLVDETQYGARLLSRARYITHSFTRFKSIPTPGSAMPS